MQPKMSQALLIVDMLNDFFREGFLAARRSALTASINALVANFRNSSRPIIWVRQEFEPSLSDAFLSMKKSGRRITIAGTDGCLILPELHRSPQDPVVIKKRYSAFFGTNLEALLSKLGVTSVVIAGVNTHACVRTAAIDAYQYYHWYGVTPTPSTAKHRATSFPPQFATSVTTTPNGFIPLIGRLQQLPENVL